MAYQTWELWKMAIDAVGVRPLARAYGVTEATVYRWARPPVHEDPDGTGAPNPTDRIESAVEALAFREAGRPVLRIWRMHHDALYSQALDGAAPRPISPSELKTKLPKLLREFADVVEAVGADEVCAKAIAKEWSELVDLGERLIPRVWAGVEHDEPERPATLNARPVVKVG